MIYGLDQGPTEADIIKQCIRDRRPFPDAITNAPELRLGLSIFYTAFMDLTSCRAMGSSAPGPVPWTAINDYCKAYSITGEQREDLFYHVEHLDAEYLKWCSRKAKQKQPPPKEKPPRRKR